MWHLVKSRVFKTILGWVSFMLNRKDAMGNSEKDTRVEEQKNNLKENQEKNNNTRLNESMRKQVSTAF